MGDYPPYGTGHGNLPTRGSKLDNGEISEETGGGGTGIPTAGGSNERSGL